MLHETIQLTEAGGRLVTYILEASDQIQIGKKRPFVIICPGGAYLRTSDQEAEQVALHFAALGCHTAVLRYSCGKDTLKGIKKGDLPNPLKEIGMAIALCRDNAGIWNVDPDRIIVNGYSAGGHLCAMACTRYEAIARSICRRADEIRPNAAILGYPCIDLLADITSLFASSRGYQARGGFFDDGKREKNDSGHAGGGQAVQGNIRGAGYRRICAEGICASAEA